MRNFKAFFFFESATDQYQIVSNYVNELLKHDNVMLSDFQTVLNLIVKRLMQSDPQSHYGLFADYNPLLNKLIDKMSAEDQVAAKKLIKYTMTMGDLPEKLSVFGVTRPNMNMEQFTTVLHNAIDGKYSVPVMQKFIDQNAYLWKEVDENLKQEFLNWMTQELEKMKNQPTLAQMLKDMFDKLEPEQ
jgi:hypothetical protein